MALLDTFSCPRRPRLTPTRALWARATATGHAVVLSPLGSHIALKRAHPRAQGGLVHALVAHRVGQGAVAARGVP